MNNFEIFGVNQTENALFGGSSSNTFFIYNHFVNFEMIGAFAGLGEGHVTYVVYDTQSDFTTIFRHVTVLNIALTDHSVFEVFSGLFVSFDNIRVENTTRTENSILNSYITDTNYSNICVINVGYAGYGIIFTPNTGTVRLNNVNIINIDQSEHSIVELYGDYIFVDSLTAKDIEQTSFVVLITQANIQCVANNINIDNVGNTGFFTVDLTTNGESVNSTNVNINEVSTTQSIVVSITSPAAHVFANNYIISNVATISQAIFGTYSAINTKLINIDINNVASSDNAVLTMSAGNNALMDGLNVQIVSFVVYAIVDVILFFL